MTTSAPGHVEVSWDADGATDLPSTASVPGDVVDRHADGDEEAVADYLSNHYGFCVNGWNWTSPAHV